ncbi:MAG: ABC transporter ATP-binding protein, partial [Desulfuromonadales bacterium]|nr:ABC transporter ATP-binding protein [Desulfuromonadales bacterium]
EGMVSWEGQDLKHFTAQAWRRQVSVVCQDFARFDLSIAENIWLGDIERDSNDDKLLAAARIAGGEEVIKQFPGGLQTALGTQYENGQELSVGEWQRIALSRAYFRQAKLLILDEPSSALDPLAEAEMIRSFREVIGKRSALIISHRLSTVQLADRIYVLDDGQVVEQGTHQELLQQDCHYAKLYSSQAAHYRNQ